MTDKPLIKNFLASIIVFLVSIPYCLSIAVASGVPAGTGILSGIVGAIVVGSLSSSGLLISGPAGGLIAITLSIIEQYGIEKLGIFVLLAGFVQVALGIFRLGNWFQAVSPAVIHGLLTGIGVIIFSRQSYAVFDLEHKQTTMASLWSLPHSIYTALLTNSNHYYHAALVGLTTIIIIMSWEYIGRSLKSQSLIFKPGYSVFIALVIEVLASKILVLKLDYLSIDSNIHHLITLPDLSSFKIFLSTEALLLALSLAFIASVQSILSAIAIDKVSPGLHKDFNKEILAQGVGNTASGILGLIPLTGIVIRGTTNIYSGATNRSSAILQGVWMILLISFFSNYLNLIPKSCLAAILVYLSFHLINLTSIKELFKYGQNEFNVFFVTVLLIVVGNLLLGIIVGTLLAFFHFLYSFTQFNYQVNTKAKEGSIHIQLRGYASFFNLPKISTELNRLPNKMNLHIRFGKLVYVDYAFFDFLKTWEKQYVEAGGKVFVEWEQLQKEIKISF